MKNLRTPFFILSASMMMVYNLSCATVGFSRAADQNEEASSVADESYEHISVDPFAPEIKIKAKKIIVQPVTRRVASDE
ncbi:MAG: hypothetical protein K2P92_05615 [Bdellovibrionaceae bacterium]|nr:hypothetical protein [Pseudobdellovibrionaceae bacterium]